MPSYLRALCPHLNDRWRTLLLLGQRPSFGRPAVYARDTKTKRYSDSRRYPPRPATSSTHLPGRHTIEARLTTDSSLLNSSSVPFHHDEEAPHPPKHHHILFFSQSDETSRRLDIDGKLAPSPTEPRSQQTRASHRKPDVKSRIDFATPRRAALGCGLISGEGRSGPVPLVAPLGVLEVRQICSLS